MSERGWEGGEVIGGMLGSGVGLRKTVIGRDREELEGWGVGGGAVMGRSGR